MKIFRDLLILVSTFLFLCPSLYAHSDLPLLFEAFIGDFRGNASDIPDDLKFFGTTGSLNVTRHKKFIAITTWSLHTPKLEIFLTEDSLLPGFQGKNIRSVTLEDGNTEQRIGILQKKILTQGVLKQLFEPEQAQEVTILQLKFIKNELSAFRIQRGIATDGEKINKLTYFIEVKNVRKVELTPEEMPQYPSEQAANYNWDF